MSKLKRHYMFMREQFTANEIGRAYQDADGNMTRAAKALTALGRGEVSRQLLAYWIASSEEVITVGGTDVAYDQDLARTEIQRVNAAKRASSTARTNKVLVEALLDQEELLNAIRGTVASLCDNTVKPPILIQHSPHGTPLTVELLLSDWQIGKLSPDYNSEVAIKRIKAYTGAALFQIKQKQLSGYHIDEIRLCLLGDIIESDKKHLDSGRACDIGTSEQAAKAIDALYTYVIKPLTELGTQVKVICITGNHDHDGHGMKMYQAGKEHLSYIIYKSLEMLMSSFPHVSFVIPKGQFYVDKIYGQRVLYEHGVGVSVSEKSMRDHKAKRADQVHEYITYFRMGDKHTVSSFNSGQYIVNGAFFGTDEEGAEYSSASGYSSVAAQWMGFHTPRNDSRFTLYDSFTIQLGHVL